MWSLVDQQDERKWNFQSFNVGKSSNVFWKGIACLPRVEQDGKSWLSFRWRRRRRHRWKVFRRRRRRRAVISRKKMRPARIMSMIFILWMRFVINFRNILISAFDVNSAKIRFIKVEKVAKISAVGSKRQFMIQISNIVEHQYMYFNGREEVAKTNQSPKQKILVSFGRPHKKKKKKKKSGRRRRRRRRRILKIGLTWIFLTASCRLKERDEIAIWSAL